MTMYRYKHFLPVLVTLAVFAVVFWPTYAHAVSLFDFSPGMTAVKFILQLAIDFMEVIHKMLAVIMSWLGSLLTAIVGNPEMNYGGPAIYVVWKLLRDICNSLFIVFFILIAFSTIFHTIWKGGGAYYYRSALMNVVLAAILINFSLPIGQTIVFAGNQAAVIASKLMSGQNIGAKFASALKLPQRVSGAAPVPPISTVPDEVTPLNQQGPVQKITSETYIGAAKTAFENCLKYNTNKTVMGCSALAAKVTAEENARKIDEASKPTTVTGAATGAWAFVKGAAVTSWNYYRDSAVATYQAVASGYETISSYVSTVAFGNSATDLAMRLLSVMINNFLILIMIIGFLFVIVFMVLRIPMIWLLLATSSLAFFTLAVPGSDRLKKWFGDIVGYSIFAPLYLLAIYIGMFVLSQQNTLLSGLKNAAWYDGVIGVFLFYFIAAAIFILGAGAAWKTAFAWSSDLEKRVTGLASTLGVDEKSNFGINTIARRTGLTARYQGAKAGIQSVYERKFTKPQARRDEEIEARYKARFGDSSALDAMRRKRIEEQLKKDKEGGKNLADLRKTFNQQLNAANPDEKFFAAAKVLMDEGELDDKQMKLLQTKAQGYSGTYGQTVREATLKKLKEKAKEKKFKDVNDVMSALSLVGETSDEAENLLKSVRSNNPRLYADLLTKKIGTAQDLTKNLSGSAFLEESASKLSDEDLVQLFESGTPLGENVEYMLNSKLSGKGNQKLLFAAKKETREKLKAEIKKRQKEAARSQAEEKEELEAVKQQAADERAAAKRDQQNQRAAERAVALSGGIDDARREEIKRELAEYKKNNPNS